MANVEKMREEFEISFAAQTACMLPEGEGVSRKDFATILLAAMVDDRKGDSYGTDLCKVGWWAWQASRQAVVVELPKIDPREWACTQDECLAIQQGLDMAKRKIEAQGLRVGVQK